MMQFSVTVDSKDPELYADLFISFQTLFIRAEQSGSPTTVTFSLDQEK